MAPFVEDTAVTRSRLSKTSAMARSSISSPAPLQTVTHKGKMVLVWALLGCAVGLG